MTCCGIPITRSKVATEPATGQKMALVTAVKKDPRPAMCSRHRDEPIAVFSVTHAQSMCLKCAMAKHESLSEFVPVSEGVSLMRKQAVKMLDEIATLSATTQTLKRDNIACIERLHSSKKAASEKIKNLRQRLNRHLDMLEQRASGKIRSLFEKGEYNYMKDKRDIRTLEHDLKRISDKVEGALKGNDPLEFIETIVNEKDAYNEKKTQARKHQTKGIGKCINFNVADGVNAFVENVKDFGEVSFHTMFYDKHESASAGLPQIKASRHSASPQLESPRDMKTNSKPKLSPRNRDKGTKKQPKLSPRDNNVSPSYILSTRRLPVAVYNTLNDSMAYETDDAELMTTANHDGPCSITGIAALSNGIAAVSDAKHRCIQLVNRHSRILDEISFRYKPADVASTAGFKLAVSFQDKDFISVYLVSENRFVHVRDISVSGKGGSYSISFCKNRFAVCRRGEIRIISGDDGTLLNVIQIEAHYPQVAMGDSGSKIYLSDFVGGRVVCLTDTGKSRWEYTREDLEPCSIALDLNQLYIADANGKVLVLSTFGIPVREIDCPGHLRSLCVDINSSNLLVTQESNDKLRSRTVIVISI